MQELGTDIGAGTSCPVCQSRLEADAVFCGRCGTFLRGESASPDALNLPVVHLLTQVCMLQKELLRQFRAGQAIQARQFQRALEVQSSQLESTLAHAAVQMETHERRLQYFIRSTAGLAALAMAL